MILKELVEDGIQDLLDQTMFDFIEISVYEAKSKLSEMINKALAGEEIIVTRNGEPKIRLTPIIAKQKLGWFIRRKR